jgi:hypothetical protein
VPVAPAAPAPADPPAPVPPPSPEGVVRRVARAATDVVARVPVAGEPVAAVVQAVVDLVDPAPGLLGPRTAAP